MDIATDRANFEAKHAALEESHAADLAKIEGNKWLSPEGKREKAKEADNRFRGAVEGLQAAAREDIADSLTAVNASLAKARTAAAARRRDVLGIPTVASIEARRLATMDARGILRHVQEAADDTDRLLLAELGGVELAARIGNGPDPEQASSALYELQKLTADPAVAKADGQMRELRSFEGAIERASPDYKKELKARYNIK